MRAAMRCTAPINAPGPPPTMPRRRRRCLPCCLDSAGMFTLLPCRKPQHSPVGFLVGTGFCKIVERALGDLNDVPLDKRCALPRALLAALQAAFPFEHCPAIKTILCQFGKDAAEIHLPVAERPEAPRTLHPWLVSNKMLQRLCPPTDSRNLSKVTPSCRSSPGCSSKQRSTPAASNASRIGRQRFANSSNAVSMSPGGRCGQG